jgi:bifunctional DNase/RNase
MSQPARMIELVLARIVLRDTDRAQQILLQERDGPRGFPMVIGRAEAEELQRIVDNLAPARPLTHQLALHLVEALGSRILHADIVDLRDNTFYAQLALATAPGDPPALVDARPSDAIALALRARAPLRITDLILDQVRTDTSGPDPLPPPAPPSAPPSPPSP